jgi:hypothetical protein
MQELLLLKTPLRIRDNISDHVFVGERVVGVALTDSPMVLEYRQDFRNRKITEEVISLRDREAPRVVDFYTQTLAREPSERPFFNCHLFAFYALGKATALKRYEHYNTNITPVEHDTKLMPSEVYGATTEDGVINHSILVIDRPGRNISVIGDHQPLVVGHVDEILPLYGAVRIQHMEPASVA